MDGLERGLRKEESTGMDERMEFGSAGLLIAKDAFQAPGLVHGATILPGINSCVLGTAFRRGHHYRSELTSDVCACAWVRVRAPVSAVCPRGR